MISDFIFVFVIAIIAIMIQRPIAPNCIFLALLVLKSIITNATIKSRAKRTIKVFCVPNAGKITNPLKKVPSKAPILIVAWAIPCFLFDSLLSVKVDSKNGLQHERKNVGKKNNKKLIRMALMDTEKT